MNCPVWAKKPEPIFTTALGVLFTCTRNAGRSMSRWPIRENGGKGLGETNSINIDKGRGVL